MFLSFFVHNCRRPDAVESIEGYGGDRSSVVKVKLSVAAALTGGAAALGTYRARKPKPLGVNYSDAPTKVLIVGGGFGGLAVAPSLVHAAERRLAAQKVEVINGVKATEVSPSAVVLSDRRTILARTTVWAAGVEPPPLVRRSSQPGTWRSPCASPSADAVHHSTVCSEEHTFPSDKSTLQSLRAT